MIQISITDLRALVGDTQVVAVHVLIVSGDCQRDARTYRILPEHYAAMRLRVGEIAPDTVDALEQAATLAGAICRGLRVLSYSA